MPWTEEEDRKLRAFWEEGMTSGQIEKYMKGRSKNGILKRARLLGLKKRWTHNIIDQRAASVFHNKSGLADENLRNIQMMKVGSETMEMVLKGHMKAPEGLIWDIGSGGWSKQINAYPVYEEEVIERVDRDPCPRCGSRPDQCNHETRGRLICA